MSRPQDHVKATLKRMLTDGLNARSVEIAYQHAEEWVAVVGPSMSGERGGSSSPTEIEESQARARTSRHAAEALEEIPRLAKLLDDTARQLHHYTQRLTALDLSLVPDDPACKSCARTEREGQSKIGGHHAEVYVKAKKWGLCEWCWNHSEWNEHRTEIVRLPPVKACDLMHTQSARAAGVWMAKAAA